MSSIPKYRVYTVLERTGGSSFWLKLGNAVGHKDGKGISMTLQALPVSGALVLRQVEDEAEAASIDTAGHERVPDMSETA